MNTCTHHLGLSCISMCGLPCQQAEFALSTIVAYAPTALRVPTSC